MPIIEVMPKASFEVWHNGVLVAIVYDDKVLVNSAEDVDIIFGDADDNKAWMS